MSAPSSRLGRSAALIHGVCLLSAAITCIALWHSAGMATERETQRMAILGVGGPAAVIFALWSLALAVRALRKGEVSRWPWVVIAVFLLEFAFACLLSWNGFLTSSTPIPWLVLYFVGQIAMFPRLYNGVNAIGLPVFGPVAVLALFIAAPVARWRVRRAERRAVAAGQPPWDRRWRWKHGLWWTFGVGALVTLLVLPWPLFLYCAWRSRPDDWRETAVRNTPAFVGEGVASVVSLFSGPWWTDAYARVLKTGRVSPARLRVELNHPNKVVRDLAFRGLCSADRAAAMNLSIKVGYGQVAPGPDPYYAGELVGTYGVPGNVRHFLDVFQSPPPPGFRRGLIRGITDERRHDLYPDVRRYVEADPAELEDALLALADIDSQDEIEKFWTKLIQSGDPRKWKEAISAIPYIEDDDTSLKVALVCLEHADPAVRREIFDWMDSSKMNPQLPRNELTKRVVRRLTELLDDSDLEQRREAAMALQHFTTQDLPAISTAFYSAYHAPGAPPPPQPPPPPPEAPAERAEIEAVRAGAKKWLEEATRK